MRNLLMTLGLCGIAQLAFAATECPAPAAALAEKRPAAELISAAAAQAPIGAAAAKQAALMVPASVHASPTQVMGAARGDVLAESPQDAPRRGSRLAMVLAAVGVMLVIVLRRLGAST